MDYKAVDVGNLGTQQERNTQDDVSTQSFAVCHALIVLKQKDLVEHGLQVSEREQQKIECTESNQEAQGERCVNDIVTNGIDLFQGVFVFDPKHEGHHK